MAGLACAEQLVASGRQVRLFDKGRGPGGRMATRRVQSAAGEASFDHGAQYFTARDRAFNNIVATWQADGAVARWPAVGRDAWVGVPAMNAPIKNMAAKHDVDWSVQIDSLIRRKGGWQVRTDERVINELFETVIVAIPAEQAVHLLLDWEAEFASIAGATQSQPCWALMLAFAEPLITDQTIVQDDPIIRWAARNSNKPLRTDLESWVIQASPEWSLEHLEASKQDVAEALFDRFAQLIDLQLPNPTIATAHRWRYARSGGTETQALYNATKKLGVCGDWLVGPRVECAWLSGTSLATSILADERSICGAKASNSVNKSPPI